MKIMKQLFLVVLFLGIYTISFGQDTLQIQKDTIPVIPTPNEPYIHFPTKDYSFGTIKMGKATSQVYEFTNTGKKTLKIRAVQTGCDCTTVIWEKTSVEPGQKGKITVVYSPKPNQIGEQKKNILVISNAVNKEERLYLKGTVEP
jgi:hypothetical protein